MNIQELKERLVPGARFRAVRIDYDKDRTVDSDVRVVASVESNGRRMFVVNEGPEIGIIDANSMALINVPAEEGLFVDEGPGKWGLVDPDNPNLGIHFELLDPVPPEHLGADDYVPPPELRKKALDGAKKAVANYERKQAVLQMGAVVDMIAAKLAEHIGKLDLPKVDKSEGAKPSVH